MVIRLDKGNATLLNDRGSDGNCLSEPKRLLLSRDCSPQAVTLCVLRNQGHTAQLILGLSFELSHHLNHATED